MSVRVATALLDSDFEGRLVQTLSRVDVSAQVIRRCLDLIELRSVAGARLIDVAVVDPGIRGFDRDVVSELHALGVRVIGVCETEDREHAVVAALGVDAVVLAQCDAICSALRGGVALSFATATASSGSSVSAGSRGSPPGRVVAVWGPLGSPGRTTLATAIADQLGRVGVSTLLADADSYGPSIAQHVGLLDDASGLAAACRLGASGRLDVAGLHRCAVALPGGLRVLTGIARPERWEELRPASLEMVWSVSRQAYAVTVVDIGFCIEHDEVSWADGTRSQRNQASVSTLATAEMIIAVCDPMPVGLVRFVREFARVRSLSPTAEMRVLVNRSARRDEVAVRALLQAQLGIDNITFIPSDAAAVEAWRLGGTIAETSKRSNLHKAVEEFARSLGGLPDRKKRRRNA